MTIHLSPASYKATLRDLGHVWANDMPSFNYRIKRTVRVSLYIAVITGAR